MHACITVLQTLRKQHICILVYSHMRKHWETSLHNNLCMYNIIAYICMKQCSNRVNKPGSSFQFPLLFTSPSIPTCYRHSLHLANGMKPRVGSRVKTYIHSNKTQCHIHGWYVFSKKNTVSYVEKLTTNAMLISTLSCM